MHDFNYQVISLLSGNVIMEAPESCRYPPRVELSLLEAGYTIKLNGKKLTKAEIKKRGDRK